MTRASGSGRQAVRVVVLGFGPVAARLVEELLPQVIAGGIQLTVVGAEPHRPYNRVLLADVAVGSTDHALIDLADPAWEAAGVIMLTSTRALSIDRARRAVLLDTGARLTYDRLVFATGARAVIPHIDGLGDADPSVPVRDAPENVDRNLPRGVTVLRDLDDAATVLAHVEAGHKIVILGGGVLGLELAVAVAARGAEVCVVHTGSHPMARNLDVGGGRTIVRALSTRGVATVAGESPTGVSYAGSEDGRRFDGLTFADGRFLRGDLLVISCGVSARTELARAAGLPVAAGILVDHSLRSWFDERIYAIGDCAQLAEPRDEADAAGTLGAPSGLIAPGWRQAAQVARQFAGTGEVEASSTPERSPVLMLKAEGIDVVAAGRVTADPWNVSGEPDSPDQGLSVSQWADPEHGRYVKMVTRDGTLEGMVCVGMPRTAAELTLLYDTGRELPADRSVLLRYDGPDYEPDDQSGSLSLKATICWCNGVNVAAIVASIDAGNTTVECVGKATRAGTGCGGCKGRIGDVLERHRPLGDPAEFAT